ncbi:MAG: cytochrome c biogenesis protein CcdA [Actinobacteria bacterium]|uniref:Unannotated protein n=1 Tax=freshwater metagenome TaxID=449393 RepID=A0A6J5YMT7_9ZZZZ|nr:cytochrome c biogenesis protein CcdA [Actinomycetota bacterium]
MFATEVTQTLTNGSLLLAIPVAMFAGFISFVSPCVLPLVPGYLSYVAGVAGVQASERKPSRTRVLVGTMAFVLGFSLVFISFGAAFGSIGQVLLINQRAIQTVMGVFIIAAGLVFLGIFPKLQREFRIHRTPKATVTGAFMLGFVFALGWTPCIGPALATVQTMALSEASASRGAILGFAFCVGLGVPFMIFALFVDRGTTSIRVIRRHSRAIMRIGGIMMIAVGVLQMTGMWNQLMVELRVWAS